MITPAQPRLILLAGSGSGAAVAARALPGSGLGLAIVRRIADMHGGTVEAIPQQQGVQFRLSVPEIAVDPPAMDRPQGGR